MAYDADGSPSSGYPFQVSISKQQDNLSLIGSLTDPVTGYSASMITVFTGNSGRAVVEAGTMSSSTFMATGSFATMFADGEVGDIGFDMPSMVEVGVTDDSDKVITLADIPGSVNIPVEAVEDGFAIFPLPEDEYPYPYTIRCIDDEGYVYKIMSLHPELQLGINFDAGMIAPGYFLYSVMDNAIFIPDVSITSISVAYSIRPFYVTRRQPRVLHMYNRRPEVSVAPNASMSQRLNAAVLNGGIVNQNRTATAIKVSSNLIMGPTFRDSSGNALSGTLKLYPDVLLYLWVEYPNPNGIAPLRRVDLLYMPNPLHAVQEAINYVRG